jgi:hypothetical protein
MGRDRDKPPELTQAEKDRLDEVVKDVLSRPKPDPKGK